MALFKLGYQGGTQQLARKRRWMLRIPLGLLALFALLLATDLIAVVRVRSDIDLSSGDVRRRTYVFGVKCEDVITVTRFSAMVDALGLRRHPRQWDGSHERCRGLLHVSHGHLRQASTETVLEQVACLSELGPNEKKAEIIGRYSRLLSGGNPDSISSAFTEDKGGQPGASRGSHETGRHEADP